MARPVESKTVTIRITEKGKREYDRLQKRYQARIRRAAFLEEVLEVYEQCQKQCQKKDDK